MARRPTKTVPEATADAAGKVSDSPAALGDRPAETAEGSGSAAPSADPAWPAASQGAPVVAGLSIAARRDGFRRAGIAHTKAPVVHSAEVFSREQIRALLEDPMLTTVELVLPDGEIVTREQMLARLQGEA